MLDSIVVLEGISGAGKSTLSKRFLDKNYTISLDLEYAYASRPEYPPFSIELSKAIAGNRWFLNKEVERCSAIMTLPSPRKVVAERWYYSILAFSQARSKLFGTQDGPQLEQDIRDSMKQKKLFDTTLIVLDVPVSEALSRLYKRYKGDLKLMDSLHLTRPFLSKEREYYLALAKDRGALLIDTRTSENDTFEKIMKIVNSRQRLQST